jgi:hypothetical protein
MQMSGDGAARALDLSVIITQVKTVQDARKLPVGTVVGDKHGGVTFSDVVAAELEKRSHSGWNDIAATNDRWTVIFLNR